MSGIKGIKFKAVILNITTFKVVITEVALDLLIKFIS